MKDDKERNYFSRRIMFGKCLLPMLKCVWKVHHKNELFNGKKYAKKLTLSCSHKCLCTFPHSYALLCRSVFEKTILCETNNIFYSHGNQKLDETNG